MVAPAEVSTEEKPIGLPELLVRATWIGVRLVLVYYLGQQGTLFFYQVF